MYKMYWLYKYIQYLFLAKTKPAGDLMDYTFKTLDCTFPTQGTPVVERLGPSGLR